MKTEYQANRDLANAFGKAGNNYPNTYYIALSSSPTITEAGFTELPFSNGYARAVLQNESGAFTTADNKEIATAVDISFNESTSSWDTIYAVAIFDAATGGNMLFIQEIVDSSGNATSRPVPANTIVRFTAGSLVWRES